MKTKNEIVKQLADDIQHSQAMFAFGYEALPPELNAEMRAALQEVGVRVRVVKNRLFKIAGALTGMDLALQGLTLMVTTDDAEMATSVISPFVRQGKLAYQQGFNQRKLLAKEEMEAMMKTSRAAELQKMHDSMKLIAEQFGSWR